MTINFQAEHLKNNPRTWLVTGVAGFIGSNLLHTLLSSNQYVVGVDNFSTGYMRNLDEVKEALTEREWNNFNLITGDIRDLSVCHQACQNIDFVLHQAALGSVPRSIENPLITHQNNIDGFFNMILAARDAGVHRFVYAASSSSYGDHPDLPKVESKIGKPLSPYAVTKLVNELYADIFYQSYGLEVIGLRYFNVFGSRQDPGGAYAAVIPKWIAAMLTGESIYINGDGETSRDFCYVKNVIQANILAAITTNSSAINQVYNVAVGQRTSLNQLFCYLRDCLSERFPHLAKIQPIYSDFRVGDVRHSLADIEKIKKMLGYFPEYDVAKGLGEALHWYINFYDKKR